MGSVRAALWCLVVGCASVLVVASLFAINSAIQMAKHDACDVPIYEGGFHVRSAETLDVDWFPPRVRCRYEIYSPEPVTTVWSSRWRTYAPFPVLAVLVGAVVALRATESHARPPTYRRSDA